MANQPSTELRQDHQPAMLAPTGFGAFRDPVRAAPRRNKLIKLLGTTDAKQTGLPYLISSFFFSSSPGSRR
ncbi:hypothetical protein AB0C04_24200 [Micromonospora sp. NPDC048909]|uniref:hypothetical protein n=1 Tax=Micromonospora sp. NPDC048909 TaxID=3155643 RepID=UPI0033E8DC3B